MDRNVHELYQSDGTCHRPEVSGIADVHDSAIATLVNQASKEQLGDMISSLVKQYKKLGMDSKAWDLIKARTLKKAPRKDSEQHKDSTNELEHDAFLSHGISLKGFWNFIESLGGEQAFRGMDCTEVKDKFVKEVTTSKKTSYCSMIEESEIDLSSPEVTVGKANLFVSFAFSSDFLLLFRCLQDYMKSNVENCEQAYIWITFFSVNQHAAGKRNMEFWSGTFMESIRGIGRVVLIAMPYDDPTPLSRAWCIWEIYCAVKTESKFEVAMDKDDEKRFLMDMIKEDTSFFDLLGNINTRNSDANLPQDRADIHAAIKREVGFEPLKSLVYKAFRDWTVGCMDKLSSCIKARFRSSLSHL